MVPAPRLASVLPPVPRNVSASFCGWRPSKSSASVACGRTSSEAMNAAFVIVMSCPTR